MDKNRGHHSLLLPFLTLPLSLAMLLVIVPVANSTALGNSISNAAQSPNTAPSDPTPSPVAPTGIDLTEDLLPQEVSAVGQWQQISSSTAPSPRAGIGTVYDSFRKQVTIVGGSYYSTRYSETWDFSDTTWTKRSPANQPSGRNRPSIAYDPKRRVTVLFGGSVPGDSTFYNDTWEFDGNDWIQKSPYTPPSPRNGATMVYDQNRGKMVLFGGYRWEGRMVFFDETWEYDGAQWIQVFPLSKPVARETAAMGYDSARGKVVLFGGGRQAGATAYNDTWEWNGINWSQIQTGSAPAARWAHAMAYDQGRQVMVMHGGLTGTTGAFSDMWEYDGITWTRVVVSPSPPARWDHGMAYDAERNRFLLFGGAYYQAGFFYRGDTWSYAMPLPAPQRPVVLVPGFAGTELIAKPVRPECPQEEVRAWVNVTGLPWWNILPWSIDDYVNFGLSFLPLDESGEIDSEPSRCTTIEARRILDRVVYELGPVRRVATDNYQTLITNFQQGGYSVTHCPYDWRRFIDGNGIRPSFLTLDQCVSAAQGGDPNKQVDIVAHSMGGLVTLQYLLSSPERASRVHTVVTLGTPYLGSVKPLILLRYGKTTIEQLDNIASPDIVRDISRNAPGAYQLLPSEAFFSAYPHGYFASVTDNSLDRPSTYAGMREFLASQYNSSLVDRAHEFHANGIDNWQDGVLADVQYYIFYGTGVDTPRKVGEKIEQRWWQLNPQVTYSIVTADGDDTALTKSATLLGGANASDARLCRFPSTRHTDLPNDPTVWRELDTILRGGTSTRCVASQQVNAANVETTGFEVRQIEVFGSADVHIYDNQMRHSGPMKDTHFIENNIPLVTYLADTNQTIVGLPPISTYTITAENTTGEPVTIRVRKIKETESVSDSVQETVVFQDLTVDSFGSMTLLYDPLAPASSMQFSLDTDGDQVTDTQIGPSSVLNQIESNDLEPPITSFQVAGARNDFGYYVGDVSIALATSDAGGAGVDRTEYSIDNGQAVQEYSNPFVVSADRTPNVLAQSIDRAGNSEYPQVNIILRPRNYVGGYVFIDANQNGVREPSEVGVEGLHVTATPKEGGEDTTTITNGEGRFVFVELPEGEYIISLRAAPGTIFTTSSTYLVSVTNGAILIPETGVTYSVFLPLIDAK